MTVYRLYTDESGESRVKPVELPTIENPGQGVASVRVLRDVPVTIASIAEMTAHLKGAEGLHPAPHRQLLVMLRGAYEVSTPAGESYVLGPGDVLFTGDTDGRGHYTRDVGDEHVAMITVRVEDDDWEFPIS